MKANEISMTKPIQAERARLTITNAFFQRRLESLFRTMASDYLLREQFVTDPSQIISEYVLGKRIAEEDSYLLNRLIFSTASNPKLLNWLSNYVRERKHHSFVFHEFILEFGSAVVECRCQQVVTSFFELGLSGQKLSINVGLIQSILMNVVGQWKSRVGLTGGPPTGGPPTGGPPTGGPPTGGPPTGGPPTGGPPTGGPPTGGPPTGGPPTGGPPTGGPPTGGPPTGGPPSSLPDQEDLYYQITLNSLVQYSTMLLKNGALDVFTKIEANEM